MARSAVGQIVFAKTKGVVDNLKAWMSQNAGKHWSTADEFGSRLGKVVEEQIAKEVRQAIADYMADSEYGLSVKDGRVLQRLRLYNSEASLITEVDLFKEILTGIGEAKQHIDKPESQEYLAAVANGLRQCISEIQRNSVPEPKPAEPEFAVEDNPFVENGAGLDQFR